MTKTEAAKLAREARLFGYFDATLKAGGKLSVRCPICRELVETANHYPYKKLQNLDRAVSAHLIEAH